MLYACYVRAERADSRGVLMLILTVSSDGVLMLTLTVSSALSLSRWIVYVNN